MKTLILQAYQHLPGAGPTPDWIERCMSSVAVWANERDYDYRRLSDGFFETVPAWFAARCGGQVHSVTDLARLLLMRQALAAEYDRVAWLDADVLVFDPDALSIDTESGFQFGYGHFVGVQADGTAYIGESGPNNGLLVAHRDHPLLSFYIYAIEAIVRDAQPGTLSRTALGPEFIHRLAGLCPLECNLRFGWLTPAIQQELSVGQTRLAQLLAARQTIPLAAVDLCHFFRAGQLPEALGIYDSMVGLAIDCLLATRGAALKPASTPARKGQDR